MENIKVTRQIDKSANDILTLDILGKKHSKYESTKEDSLKNDFSKNDDSAKDVLESDNWRTTIRKLFSLTHLRDSFRTCFKVRPNHGRAVLMTLLASSLLLMIISAGIHHIAQVLLPFDF